MKICKPLFAAAFLLGITPMFLFGANWPMWRGPQGDGTTTEKNFPIRWDQTENVHWKCPIPGKGHSSPIVWENHIFLTTCLETADRKQPMDRQLISIDRTTGKIRWAKTVLKAPSESIHKLNSFASSTPATDGKLVFVTFFDNPKVVIAAYDFDGNEVWRISPGDFESKHGFCSPPILYKDMVIVNCDQDAFRKKKPAYVVALEAATGKERWRIDRPNRIRSYCPPFIHEAAGKMQMVMTGCLTTASYDPDTGKQLWIVDGPTEQFVASMVYSKGMFFLTAGFPTYHVMAIKPDGMGNVTKTHVAWHETKGAGYVPSPVAAKDWIFLVHDDGRASCRDAVTGELKWLERLGKHHSASPVVIGDHVHYTDDDGITYIVKVSDEFEVVRKNPIGESVSASPALADGQIFIRGDKHLWCIGTQVK
ncbi:MAG: PQQ-binding-like beta-propeller repeat protein [Zavarzinella sp.]